MEPVRPPLSDLAPVQRAALQALWDAEQGTVYDVLARLPEPKPPYTSVLSALQKLSKFGWVTHQSVSGATGRYYVYTPTAGRDEAEREAARAVVSGVFAGDAFRLAQHLVGGDELTAAEEAELRRLLEQRRTNPGGGRG